MNAHATTETAHSEIAVADRNGGHVAEAGHQLTLQVRGPIDAVLSALAAAKPKTLISHEPSLEELFLSLYGDSEAKRGKR